MAQPHVSVIIPVFNEERYLAEAIQSVLDQDYDDLEVIVVDDGSTDRSADVARQFKGVRLIRQANAGNGAALNAGIAAAHGSLLAFLDADDIWEPAILARRVARFVDDPDLDMTHDMVVEFVSPELESGSRATRRVMGEQIPARLGGTTMVTRAAMERVGPIDAGVTLGGWMDWLMRADDMGLKVESVAELVLRRRIHGDNLTIRDPGARADYVRMLKRALDRRRQAGS